MTDPTGVPSAYTHDTRYAQVPRTVVFQLVASSSLDVEMRLTLLACLGDLPRAVLLDLFRDLLTGPSVPEQRGLNGMPYIDGRPVENVDLP